MCKSCIWLPLVFAVLLFSVQVQSQEDGNLSRKLREQVAEWLEQAEKDDPVALFNLGQFYRKGIGMEPDLQQAEIFYRRAAEQGHVAAQLNLGSLYYFADDDHSRAAEAAHWWEQASRQGDARAAYQLGLLYLNGSRQLAPDLAQAEHYLQKAKARGVAAAEEALRFISQHRSDSAFFTVQLGAFSTLEAAKASGKAMQARAALANHGIEITSVRLGSGELAHRVHVGRFSERAAADRLCHQLKAEGQSCFVARQ